MSTKSKKVAQSTDTGVVLPKLAWQESPNWSERSPGIVPYLIVAHRPVGSYHGSADWLCNPKAQASAHVLTEGNGTGVDEATQLVPWDKKAWACASAHSPPRRARAEAPRCDPARHSAMPHTRCSGVQAGH